MNGIAKDAVPCRCTDIDQPIAELLLGDDVFRNRIEIEERPRQVRCYRFIGRLHEDLGSFVGVECCIEDGNESGERRHSMAQRSP